MNCCDQYGTCNQGRDCPVRSQPAPDAAKVATARPMYTRCDVAGVCQASVACASTCQLWRRQVLSEQDAVEDANWQRTDRRIGLLLSAVFALLVGSVLLGMASVYAPVIAAALDWLLATVQLGLYRWAGAWS